MATAHVPDPEPTAVAALRDLLGELPDPLPEAWAAVHVDDLVSTVQRLDWQQLERLLSVLHALSPPSPARPACVVILELARQPALQRRITSAVTAPVRRALHEVYTDERPVGSLLAEWPLPIVRLALMQDLAPGRDAAGLTGAAVLELITSRLAPAAWAGRHDELTERARATLDRNGSRLELAYTADPDADGDADAEPPAARRDGRRGGPAPQMIARAAEVLEQARTAWERMGAALDAGSVPDDRDLDTVEAVGVALKDAAAALRAALAEIGFEQEVPPTLPGLRAAQDRWDALRLPEARAAHRLGRVDGPEDLAAPLDLLRELTAGVVERAGRWDEEDRGLADFFQRLAALIEAGADRSAPIGQLLELYNAATAASPADDFDPVFLLAIRGALTLPPDGTPGPPTLDHPEGPEDPGDPDGPDRPDDPGDPDDPDRPGGPGGGSPQLVAGDADQVSGHVPAAPAAAAPTGAQDEIGDGPVADAETDVGPVADEAGDGPGAETAETAETVETGSPSTSNGFAAEARTAEALAAEAETAPREADTAPREADTAPREADTAPRGDAVEDGPAGPAGLVAGEGEGAAGELSGVFGGLLAARRFGLAYWLAVAARRPEEVTRFLRICAQVQAVRGASGPCADELRRLLRDAPPGTLLGSQPLHPLALVVAARACLTAPFSGVAALVPELTRNLRELPALAEITRAAAGTASRCISLPDVGTPGVDLAAGEAGLRELRDEARQFLDRDRNLGFERGSQIWRTWAAPGGLLASLLGPVTDGDLTRAGARATDLLGEVDRFTDHGTAERVLREQDRRLRGHGARPIDGRARRTLLALADKAVTMARQWADAAQRLERARAAGEPDWVREPLAQLRLVVASNEADARAELARCQASSNEVAAGAAAGAAALLDETITLVTALRLDGDEPSPARALGADLLRSGVPLTGGLVPRDPAALSVAAVVEAVDRSWEVAFDARMGAGQYGTAAAVVEEFRAERAGHPDQPTAVVDGLQAELDTARGYAATLVREHATGLLDDIRRARRHGVLTEWAAADLTSRLEATLERTEPNLDVVSETLDGIVADLERQQRDAAARVRRALADLRGPSALANGLAQRVEALLGQGDVATAEELLVLAREGIEPPSAARERPAAGLEDFFPAVPDALPDGVDPGLVVAVRERATAGPLDFGRLTGEEAAAAADALAGWQEVAAGPWHERQLQTLVPALRLCGIEAASGEWLALPRSSQRRWANLLEVRTGGGSPLPQFGSSRQGRLRLLLCWKHPSASTLLDWLAQDAAGEPVVVLHFGTVDQERRLRLAAESRRRHPGRPVVVVDDAVLAFAAASGTGQLDTVLRVTLPFAAINPFVPDAGGDVPPEMFFGRRQELRQITDPDGTSLLFGGHQLGKSALLRAAARDFERHPGQVAVYARVADARSGGQALPDSPQLVWGVIWRALVAAGIADDRPGGQADGGQDDGARGGGRVSERVGEAVHAWLGGDPARRLLLLLDDCDAFFDGDAAAGFANIQRLTTLRDRSDRRLKPVFAGLHTVQRFALVPNRPLAQLGRPTPVGPLAPQAAFDLVSRPLGALGLELASGDLANRILADCNYQPVLLQLFGHALVERVLAGPPPASLPQVVDAGTVEAVAGSDDLRNRLRRAFRQTLDLDGRYKVIAYVAAAAGHAGGVDTALTCRDLRARCDDWWEAGFEGLAGDAFRALLEEMIGLGVLAPAAGGYRLRSPSTLRLLGDLAEVEDVLLAADHEQPDAGALVVTERRVVLDDAGTRSPLTEQQLADVIGQGRNQVRVVLGSPATGVGRVVATLETAARSAGFALVKPRNRSYFEQALRAARDRGHWVVVSLLCGDEERQGVGAAGCAASLEKARGAAGGPDATRSVVLVTDERNLDWWLQLFAPGLKLEGPVELVELRRYDERSLAAWALDGGQAFRDATARDQLLRVTGGWPVLVDRAAELAGQGATAGVAVETIRAELAGVDGALRLVRATGVGCPPVAPLWDQAVTLGEEGRAPADELAEVLADNPGEWLATHAGIEVLRALQALVREPDGTIGPEPVLATAWRRVKA